MKRKIFFLFIICISFYLFPQTLKTNLNVSDKNGIINQTSNDTIKILAVIVEFQEDKDANTVGNGKLNSIYSKDWGTGIIDPLPHDKDYFSAHLEFAKNYYKKISSGKLQLKYDILPGIITVSKTMKNYSPPLKSDDFTLMGELMKEVWTKVDSVNPGFNFSDYQLFTIFHAGVGRDVSLPGSLGNEKDLPSVYLGLNSLQKYFGNSYTGIPVSNGTFKITNSMILPQTENRELESFGSKYLFQVTINGLIVANIASYLGLPDLFDTKTGLSAIGRFGLMDGQAIFAYNGCFPPEPSAWEKLFLSNKFGWGLSPVEVSAGELNLNVKSRITAGQFDTTIIKAVINSSEYYLIENRQRDGDLSNPGCNVSIWKDGSVYVKRFPKDTTGFYSWNIDSLEGVIVDVDEFDWALPGKGILIWHIDEKIINSKIGLNEINNDKQNRGIDVEEADGIQDIGEKYTTIFGDVVVGEGDYEDFWYGTNTSRLYKNRFGVDTRPDTRTNSGANSLITMSNFSALGNSMSFSITFGNGDVKTQFVKNTKFLSSTSSLTSSKINDKVQYFITSNTNLYRLNERGDLIDSITSFSDYKPVVCNYGFDCFVIGVNNSNTNSSSQVNGLVFNNNSSKLFSKNLGQQISFSVINQYNTQNLLYAGTDGVIYNNSFNIDSFTVFTKNKITSQKFKKLALISPQTPTVTLSFVAVTDYKLFSVSSSIDSVVFTDEIKDLAAYEESKGNYKAVILSGNSFYIYDIAGKKLTNIYSSSENISSFSLAELKLNGNHFILFIANKKLYAITLSGAVAENFPFEDPQGIGFEKTPLAVDFSGDDKPEVIGYTTDGRIFAVDGGSGKLVTGFPISTGNNITSSPLVYEDDNKIFLAAATNDKFFCWQIGGRKGKIYWSQENGNNYNNSFIDAPVSLVTSSEFFPKSKAYNWPNPVYDGITYIRYYVSEDSKINIKIFDLSGDFVAELNNSARGGMDNETTWNVKDIQSGVYLARIEAVGSSGKTESTVIKIAVIK